MRVNALVTGSKGNSYLIEISQDISSKKLYILLDCGISYSELLEYCSKYEISLDDIKYLLITHEHSDHIKGVEQLLKKHPNITIITSKGVSDFLQLDIKIKEQNHTLKIISANDKFLFENFEVFAFEKSHDCIEPLSFIVKCLKTHTKSIFLTDLGDFTDFHMHLLKRCDIIFLEANYDESLIKSSNMHYTYINRVVSSYGHLSNLQAVEICKKIIDAQKHIERELQHKKTIVLSHISQNLNSYERAYLMLKSCIDSYAGEQLRDTILLRVSFQHSPTGWIE